MSLIEEVPLAEKFPKLSAWGWETGNETRAALACGLQCWAALPSRPLSSRRAAL